VVDIEIFTLSLLESPLTLQSGCLPACTNMSLKQTLTFVFKTATHRVVSGLRQKSQKIETGPMVKI